MERRGICIKDFVNIDLSDIEILGIINSISLTLRIIEEGDPNKFHNFFLKKDYFEHYNNLTNIRKRLEICGNRDIYGSRYYYMYWGQYIYFRENSCLESYEKNYKKYNREIKDYNKRDLRISNKTDLEKEYKIKNFFRINKIYNNFN